MRAQTLTPASHQGRVHKHDGMLDHPGNSSYDNTVT